jgi:hypothetical protein
MGRAALDVDRMQLDGGHSQGGEVVQARDGRVERALRGERAHP